MVKIFVSMGNSGTMQGLAGDSYCVSPDNPPRLSVSTGVSVCMQMQKTAD